AFGAGGGTARPRDRPATPLQPDVIARAAHHSFGAQWSPRGPHGERRHGRPPPARYLSCRQSKRRSQPEKPPLDFNRIALLADVEALGRADALAEAGRFVD